METIEKIKIGGGFRAVLLYASTILLITVSIFVWNYVNNSIEGQRSREFENAISATEEGVSDTTKAIVERLYDLRGFVNSMPIDDKMWQSYLISTGVENRFPGVYSFAYAPRVLRSNLSSYINQIRKDGTQEVYKTYSVFPESQNAELIPIRYLFTSDPDIGTLLGYDVRTSETQVAAITTAVTEDAPVLTDLLFLGNVISGNPKRGYEVVLPVYSKSNIAAFPKNDRKQYFVGLVGIWIFPRGLATYVNVEKDLITKGVSVVAYDGKNQLFTLGEAVGELKETREISILNKKFIFEFSGSRQKVLSPLTESLPWLTAVGLIILNLMWWVTVWAITQSRREAERLAIEATKDLRKFKQGVEGVSDLVLITDPDGVITYVNKAAEKITGYKGEYLLGKNSSVWGQQMDEEFYKNFWRTIKVDKNPFWGEVTNRRKNGELYDAEINVSPILDDLGNLLFFVGIERDLSKVKAVERMKTEFISLASHQLRTPLSAVKWFGKMLVSGDAGKLSPTQKDYVEKINESNEREIKLVNSLVNVSRIESGKIMIEPKPTDLKNVVTTTLTDFKVELEKAGKHLSVFIDKNIPMIDIDEDLIRHVYSNLISNAIRYTIKGGKIILRVYLSRNNVMSEVKDDGIGIPRGEQKRVFEKFFRASNALKKETDGTGLGLYLSRTIVESSKGRMGFRSSEGKGSTFWFSLPIKPKGKSGKNVMI